MYCGDQNCSAVAKSRLLKSVSKARSTNALFLSSSSFAITCFLQSRIIGPGSDSCFFQESTSFQLQPEKEFVARSATESSPPLKRDSLHLPLRASRGRLKRDLRTTPIEIQVILSQGSADLLMTVVVFVHNPECRPSPNRVPLQSAPPPAGGGELDPPSGMCLVGGVS